MATTSKQRLALAICDFLAKSASDGTLPADDKDSIDVAIQCIADSFKVDPNDKKAIEDAVGNQNLAQIYGVYEKLKKGTASSSSSVGSNSTTSASEPTEEQKKEADALKSRGNAAMANKDYAAAVDLYTQALAITPNNAVFLSNRAAAHSAARNHELARADAETATTLDPAYTKAWSRLGLARFALGDAKGAAEAYQKGIDAEGNGGSDAMRKGLETAKRRAEELEAEGAAAARSGGGAGAGAGAGMPDLSSLASMLGGGGGGGAGGMPDFSQIMNNPMFASMAQNLMSNPELMGNLMNNPRLRDMAEQFGSGGGVPDIGSLMQDPNIAEMARSMMGGGGGSGPNSGAGQGGQGGQ
ncbi:hypothetical protein ACRALDRAFT_1062056 [Sodiomyces alcalophilus JCM 7366]|uniref:uncharacterized protein n=1 Tax=Sodiomyces alcalophilus JCM 7366 TaxID=591952 RepID=UPI0039B45A35